MDVVPMLVQHIETSSCISAFVHWTVLGLIIPFVKWPMRPWLKGLLIGEMAAWPVMVLVFVSDPQSVIPIGIFSAILGAFVGWAGAKYVRQ